MFRPAACLLVCGLAACTGRPAPTATPAADDWQRISDGGITLAYRDADAALAPEILDGLVRGHASVETFFGAPYPESFTAYLFPDRASLDAHWRTAWKMPDFESQCWMVASGDADELAVLSPRAWKTEACEHDPTNADRVQALLTHELVHVYHGQHVAGHSFDGMDEAGWFVEGLGAYASGQLDLSYLAPASEAVATGAAPTALASAWSGKYRYGVCGSIVGFVDRRIGRASLRELLRLRTTGEILAAIGIGEAELLARWKQSITEKAGVMVPESPWSIVYGDGSGNRYRIWRDGDAARFEYTPVTPAASSSGTYSGGAPAAGKLTDEQVAALWSQVNRFRGDSSLRADARSMGTGSFTVGDDTFIVRMSDELRSFDELLASWRIKPD